MTNGVLGKNLKKFVKSGAIVKKTFVFNCFVGFLSDITYRLREEIHHKDLIKKQFKSKIPNEQKKLNQNRNKNG